MQAATAGDIRFANRQADFYVVVRPQGRPRRLPCDDAETCGEAVGVVTLIPLMLEPFIVGDRGFRRGTTIRKNATQEQSLTDSQNPKQQGGPLDGVVNQRTNDGFGSMYIAHVGPQLLHYKCCLIQ